MEEKKDEKPTGLECIRVANTNSDRLNEEGKLELAQEIVEELPIEEIETFIKKWGYKR